MNQTQKDQLLAIITVISKRHNLACDGLFQARSTLPEAMARSLLEVVPMDNHPTPAALTQLVAAVDALEVTA